MNIFYIAIAVLLIWFIFLRFIPAKGVKQLNTYQLNDILEEKKYQFIDVRTPGEFKQNHISNFKNIPLGELMHRYGELNKEQEVVLICQSGMRSNKASKLLKRLGFSKITNIKGGMAAWSHQ
ncbi:rhodanese-like domain-containing protein [Evansella cellulosilytica]|uniref:Rhodanese domain protein n=1 Tax=Evansella cellulosilytica (strain ATCC 21833 / DSM 2522 / FERM P-1141 / JCM 9156 / N-4) TaxID=649639 RepID=E6TV18_EVAC2|nr:rhodanese-like domain-containing protein [Evansella cellulosilytica]ADU28601.1 Rhodanese domain protein [Evansella cellulosilytica DSM 2522]